jgi:hypothetical protein
MRAQAPVMIVGERSSGKSRETSHLLWTEAL